jgi:hypothetical protein
MCNERTKPIEYRADAAIEDLGGMVIELKPQGLLAAEIDVSLRHLKSLIDQAIAERGAA